MMMYTHRTPHGTREPCAFWWKCSRITATPTQIPRCWKFQLPLFAICVAIPRITLRCVCVGVRACVCVRVLIYMCISVFTRLDVCTIRYACICLVLFLFHSAVSLTCVCVYVCLCLSVPVVCVYAGAAPMRRHRAAIVPDSCC